MQVLSILTVPAFLGACASISGIAYLPLTVQAPHPSLAASYVRAKDLQTAYLANAADIGAESRFVNGLGLTAGLATLGFGAFGAHQDNVTAAALVTGGTASVRPLLNTAENEELLVNSSRALQCVMTRASTLRLGPTQLSPLYTDPALASAPGGFEAAIGATDGIEALDSLLGLFIGYAESTPAPSPGLSAVLEKARASRVRIAVGLKARLEAPIRVGKAIDAIDTAVELKRADFKAILEAIAKVEIPETEPASPVTDPSAVASALGIAGVAGGAPIPDTELISILQLLNTRVGQVRPEYEEELLKSVESCQIEYLSQ